MRNYLCLAIGLCLFLTLSACGRSGPLYLPSKPDVTPPATPAVPATSATPAAPSPVANATVQPANTTAQQPSSKDNGETNKKIA